MRARQAARVHLQLVPGRGRRRPHALLHLARRRRARVRWAPAALQCARRPSGLPCLFAFVSPLLKRPDPAQGPACLQAAQRQLSKREAHSAKRPCGHAQNASCGSARAPQRAHPAAGQAARVRARRDHPARRRPAGELRGPGGARAGRAAGRRAAEHARGLARRSGRADGRGRAGAGELWRRGCLRPLPWPARRAGGRRGARGHVHAGAGAPRTVSPILTLHHQLRRRGRLRPLLWPARGAGGRRRTRSRPRWGNCAHGAPRCAARTPACTRGADRLTVSHRPWLRLMLL